MQIWDTVDRKYGRMRIVERYTTGMRIFKGRGLWILLVPLRFLLSEIYGLWFSLKGGRCQSSVGAGNRRGDSDRARIISVGNIEVGGVGKTPCAIRLVEAISERGGRPVVVTRGYRSRAERFGKAVVVPSGCEILQDEAQDFVLESSLLGKPFGTSFRLGCAHLVEALGDEVVMYRERGIPVVIDSVRARGVRVAERLFSPTDVVLDDAYQHRSLMRDLDILLLDAGKPFGDGRLLPLGTLRERPDAVCRADTVIFTRTVKREIPSEAVPFVKDKPVFFAFHIPLDLITSDGGRLPVSFLSGKKVALFSGIARHSSFEDIVGSLGVEPQVSFRFTDHHEYGPGDIELMLSAASPSSIFVTTEKDWYKAAGLFPPDNEVLALRIEMDIDGIERLAALS